MNTHQFSMACDLSVPRDQSTEFYIRNWEIYLSKLVNLRIGGLPTLI